MKKQLYNICIILILLTICSRDLYASRLCTIGAQKILRRMTLKYPTTQYQSTCYLEASLSVLENVISLQLKEEISISRPTFYARLWFERGKKFLEDPKNFMLDPDTKKSTIIAKRGIYDVLSLGNAIHSLNLANTYPLLLIPEKSQIDIFRENRVIKEMLNDIGSFLYEKKSHYSQLSRDQLEIYKKKAIKSLEKKTEKYIMEEKKNSLTILFNEQMKPYRIPRYRFTKDRMLLTYNHNSKTLYLSTLLENWINDQREMGKEMMLSYYHVDRYLDNNPERMAVMSLHNERTTIEKSPADLHLITIVDVLKNPMGRITHFVAKNSWGNARGLFRGHMLIDLSYLKAYGNVLHTFNVKKQLPY